MGRFWWCGDGGPMPQRGNTFFGTTSRRPAIVVFLNQMRQVEDPELLEAGELEVREL